MYGAHRVAPVALAQNLGENPVHLINGQALAGQFAQALDSVVNGLDLIPGGLAHHAVHLEIENLLEFLHHFLGGGGENAVEGQVLAQGRIVPGNAVQLPLNGPYLLAHVAQPQGLAGVRRQIGPRGGVPDDADIVAVELLQNLIGYQPLFRQIHSPPLAQAVAGDGGAVAILGEQGLYGPLTHHIVVENLIDNLADVFKNLPTMDVLLVILGGRGDIEVIPPAPVPLRIDPVQGKGNLRQNVGPEGRVGPGGKDFAGRHIFYVIHKGDPYIGRRFVVGQAEMDRDGLGNHRRRHGSFLPQL